MMWLYDNIDNDKYDAWAARLFKKGDWRNVIHANVDRLFKSTAAEARERQLPLVLDEVGAFLYPPKNSSFEQSEPVRDVFEHIADAAIAHGYWTFMPDTYANPHCISWEKNSAWIKYLNDKFTNGK